MFFFPPLHIVRFRILEIFIRRWLHFNFQIVQRHPDGLKMQRRTLSLQIINTNKDMHDCNASSEQEVHCRLLYSIEPENEMRRAEFCLTILIYRQYSIDWVVGGSRLDVFSRFFLDNYCGRVELEAARRAKQQQIEGQRCFLPGSY